MLDISNLKRQHREVSEIMDIMSNSLKGIITEEDAINIARNINILAGKLKIHMNHEDKFLYPYLSTSKNIELNKFSKIYKGEMERILNTFVGYKNKYNTRTKITKNLDAFHNESRVVIDLLRNRIETENESLYPLLEK